MAAGQAETTTSSTRSSPPVSDAADPVPGGEPPGPAAEPDTTTEREGTADALALQARVAELEKRVAELDNLWRRALADADNLRKRHAREMERLRDWERVSARSGIRRWTCCPGWATRAGTTWGHVSIRPATTRWPP